MSLSINPLEFGIPSSAAGFMGLLQKAFFNGVPFSVRTETTVKGRKNAIHEYPFRDGGWVEDLGRSLRRFQLTGYLLGDLAPVLQLAMDAQVESPGSNLLIHPTLGAIEVNVLAYATSVNKDAMRVITVQFDLIEAGSTVFPSTLISTAISVVAAAASCISGFGASLGGVAGPAAAFGAAPVGEGVLVTTAFTAVCIGAAADPGALVAMATGLSTATGASNGRYANGNASVALGSALAVSDLQAQITIQRAAVGTAATAAITSAGTLSTANAPAVVTAIAAMVEAMRSTMTNPADQVRVLLSLATFPYTDAAGGAGLGGDMAIVRDAISVACRRLVLASLGRAVAAYKPTSYQDAANLRGMVTAALDVEITAAADAGDDSAYNVLRDLRAAIVLDLLTRGATLPQTITAHFQLPLPALVIAQRLYRDGSRSDEIIAESGAPHPAFCPISFQALAA